MSTLPYGRQWIDEDDARALHDAALEPYLTTGPKVAEFEAALARVTGGEAVVVNSGTAALHTAYFAAGLKKADEIVTTPLTFAATANAALYLGATVRFADVDTKTGNIDPANVQKEMTARTRLVVAVDFAGHPASYDALRELCGRRGVGLVGDAAHSIGATYHGRPVGSLADLSTLSFHPVKTITTGEGGAVVCADSASATKARAFRNHGLVHDRSQLGNDEGPWYHEMQLLGFNYRLTDLQCALGLRQLARLEAFVRRRREVAARYFDALADLASIELPHVEPGVEPAWHLYVVRVREGSRRRAFFERLRALELGVQVHYIPVYWHPYYRDLGYEKGTCPVAEDFYKRAVSIPMYPKLTDSEVDRVIEGVRRAAKDTL